MPALKVKHGTKGPHPTLIMKDGKFACECCEQCGEYSLSIGITPQSCCCFAFYFSIDPEEVAIVSQEWDFGDGSTSTDANPTHCYEAPGAYLVTLMTTDENGCVKTAQAEVECACTTEEEPDAAFSYEQTDGSPCCFDFTDESVANCEGRTIVEWNWSFGDGGTSTAQNPTHCYAGDGPWDVTLVTVDSAGCESDPAVMEVVCYKPGDGCCEGMPFLPPTVTAILPTPSFPVSNCYCPSLPGSHTLTQEFAGSCYYRKEIVCNDSGVTRTITIRAFIGNARGIGITIFPPPAGSAPQWSDASSCASGTFVLTRSQSITSYYCNFTVSDTPTATLIVP